jgi:hypothetical protein
MPSSPARVGSSARPPARRADAIEDDTGRTIATGAAARLARGALLGAIVVTFGWHLVNSLPATFARMWMYHSPALALSLWAVFVAVGVVAAVDALRARRRPVLVAVLEIAVLQAGVVIQLVTSDPDLILNVGDWAWTDFGWFAILVLWRRPLAWLYAVMAANALITLGTLLATREMDRIDLARFAMVVIGAGAFQVALAWGGRALEEVAGRAYQAAGERAATLTALSAAERVHAARQRRFREIGHDVREILGGLADGGLDPGDPAVQRRCAVEASRLRRLIAEHDDTPDPLVHELRACADMAESRGVAVSLHTTGGLPPMSVRERRALTELPMHVLAAARTQARVTVVASPETAETEVSVVADADLDPRFMPTSAEVEVHFTRDGDTLWVRTLRRQHG